jgi:hypothetical protein
VLGDSRKSFPTRKYQLQVVDAGGIKHLVNAYGQDAITSQIKSVQLTDEERNLFFTK